MSRIYVDDGIADHFREQCKRELTRYPRSELPRIISRDFATGAADPWEQTDDYHELPFLLKRQAA